jgi:hypothetical protein
MGFTAGVGVGDGTGEGVGLGALTELATTPRSSEPAPATDAKPATATGHLENDVDEERTTGTAVWPASTSRANPFADTATTVPVVRTDGGIADQTQRYAAVSVVVPAPTA